MLLGLLLSSTALAVLLPGSAAAAEYSTFVGCDETSSNPVPSNACQLGDHPAAYFESDEEIEYEVCVQFPNLEFLCSSVFLAEAGVLYKAISIETGEAGQLYVYWYEAPTETEIGFWAFEMQSPPPPPPPSLSISFSAPPPTPSAACLQAQQRVRKLKARLRLANCSCQERKIRPRLRKARAAVKRLC